MAKPAGDVLTIEELANYLKVSKSTPTSKRRRERRHRRRLGGTGAFAGRT